MAHLYKMTEWESGAGGRWYCNDTSDLGNGSGLWYHPARMLNISPAEFVKMLVEKYKPDYISYNSETNVLVYSWVDQAAMRKFKNAINAESRKRNYMI